MVKYQNSYTPTPLDIAVGAFIARLVESKRVLSHVGSYTFNRTAGELHTLTITFYADKELEQFGATPVEPELDETT